MLSRMALLHRRLNPGGRGCEQALDGGGQEDRSRPGRPRRAKGAGGHRCCYIA